MTGIKMEKSNQMPKNGKLIEEKFIVEYKNELYDITDFMHKHPGGINTLEGSNNKLIDNKFMTVEHSKAAKYLMKEYKLKKPKNGEIHDGLDDSMEHLVNWNAAMIPQINRLGDKYAEWVNMPVDRPLRLFKSSIMENMSKTPWFLPLIVWFPFIIYLVHQELKSADILGNSKLNIFLHFCIGIFVWTLLEYTLHRYLFHMNVEKRPKLATVHFLLHGLHHKVPFDEYRLVFPPVPAAILASIIYQPVLLANLLFSEVVCYPRILLAGGLAGYLCYDMIHYYIHYGSPQFSYFYKLKRYHHNHHFVNHDKGFGISSPFWDIIFGTTILLRKLKYLLKW